MRPCVGGNGGQPAGELPLKLGLQRLVVRRRVVSENIQRVCRRGSGKRIDLREGGHIGLICPIEQRAKEVPSQRPYVSRAQGLPAAELLLDRQIELMDIRELEVGIHDGIRTTLTDWKRQPSGWQRDV